MSAMEVIVDDASLAATPTRVGHLFRDSGGLGEVIRFENDREWLVDSRAFAIDLRSTSARMRIGTCRCSRWTP